MVKSDYDPNYRELKCIKESMLLGNIGNDLNIPNRFSKIKTEKKILIENDQDLRNTLELLRFHMVKETPKEVKEYIALNFDNCRYILKDFSDFYKFPKTNKEKYIKKYKIWDIWYDQTPKKKIELTKHTFYK